MMASRIGLILGVATMVASASGQVVGRWDIEFSSPEEMMLSLTADRPLFANIQSSQQGGRGEGEPLSGVRPAFYLHCRNGRSRVFLEPPEPTFMFQFDAGELRMPRFVARVERGADRPALRAVSEPEIWIREMLTRDRLVLIDRHAGGGRTTFALEGLQLILAELGDPCAWLEGS